MRQRRSGRRVASCATITGTSADRDFMPNAFALPPPIEPMLAKLAEEIPAGDFLYEPKWDGFRSIVFRGTEDVFIQSRDLRPLDRYFPELHETFLEKLPPGCVIDGEIVIATRDGLDFDALQMRLHPAASRAAKLAKETPASFVGFDLLAVDGRDLREAAQRERRTALEQLFGQVNPPIHLTPVTGDRALAADWLHAVRRRGPRRRHREAGRRGVSARQARHAQDQTRPHRRLRRRRVPLAQERKRCGRVPAARALRRARQAAARRGDVGVHDGIPESAGARARTAARERHGATSVARVGGPGG